MILHSCHIHIAILTSGSTSDFILSTYITPITQLAKQIQVFVAQLVLQRLKNADLSTVNPDVLISQCPDISMIYLKTFLLDMHKST
ncbi:unnamed protein product [Rotaria sp. Silwood2]|nr:unnamed protein product [Rotaria sp. Silwood2]